MEQNILGSIKMGKNAEKENFFGQMVLFMKEIFMIIILMEKVNLIFFLLFFLFFFYFFFNRRIYLER